MMFFERELYSDLVKWVQKSRHTLYLEGPRQVGKTELLQKLGREHFKNHIYIDIKQDAEKFCRLMEYHKERFGRSAVPEEMGPVWEGVFRDFEPTYTNDPNTLVILDEIQESPMVYNAIRYIRRGLKSKLAVSGSYLGITTQRKEYWHSTGDIVIMELSSLSFREFLKANSIWDAYDQIQTIDIAKMTDPEKVICEQVRKLYRVYCEIGGYPDVVSEWLYGKDIDTCKSMTTQLLRLLYKESSNYFGDIVGGALWEYTLELVATHMVTKSGDLDIQIAKEGFRGDDSKGLEVHRKDKVNALKWLDDCKIIGMVRVYSELGKVTGLSNKLQFFFRDMGMMARLCEKSRSILPSDFNGMVAENFVYLHLRDSANTYFDEENVRSFNGSWGQIDFIMHNKDHRRFGIEVKYGSGGTKSGDKALADGKIDYLIRVQDTYGSIGDKQATVPIFMLDKLRYVVN